MKKIVIAAIVVLAFALSASAQMPSKPFSIYIGGGITLPNSPTGFKDAYNTGFHGLAALAINLPAVQGLSVQGKVQYHIIPTANSATWGIETITNGGTQKYLMFGADGLYRFGTPGGLASPYAGFGVGYANGSVSDITTASGTVSVPSNNDFYWNILAGADLQLGPTLRLFGTITYTSIATTGKATTMVPITVGLKF